MAMGQQGVDLTRRNVDPALAQHFPQQRLRHLRRLAPLRGAGAFWRGVGIRGRVTFRGRSRTRLGFHPARLELRTGFFPLQNGNLVLQTPDLHALPLNRFPQPLDDFQQSIYAGRPFVRRYFRKRRERFHGVI